MSVCKLEIDRMIKRGKFDRVKDGVSGFEGAGMIYTNTGEYCCRINGKSVTSASQPRDE